MSSIKQGFESSSMIQTHLHVSLFTEFFIDIYVTENVFVIYKTVAIEHDF